MSKENPNEFKIINKNERLKYRQTINELKQQLEEAQTRINELEDKDWFEATIKQLEEQNDRLIQERDNLKQQLAEKENMHLLDEKEFQHYCAYKHIEPEIKGCLDREREYEKQLVEKDKEIERLKQQLEETNAGYDFIYEQSGEAINELKQTQTQLAIQELEKVKNFVDGRTYCADYINKRMQDLKGE